MLRFSLIFFQKKRIDLQSLNKKVKKNSSAKQRIQETKRIVYSLMI